MHTEILQQIWKQQEDSALLLASDKQQHNEITKNRKTQQDRQNTQKRRAGTKTKWAYKKLPTYKTLYRESLGILQMLKYQKGIFHYRATL
jgi:hypothetical protein